MIEVWAPHSLGKLIEWKASSNSPLGGRTLTPHSLGKLIEWKQENLEFCHTSAHSPLMGKTN